MHSFSYEASLGSLEVDVEHPDGAPLQGSLRSLEGCLDLDCFETVVISKSGGKDLKESSRYPVALGVKALRAQPFINHNKITCHIRLEGGPAA